MRKKNKAYAHHTKTLITLAIFSIVLLLGLATGKAMVREQMIRYFNQIFEKKSLVNIDIFEKHVKERTENFFQVRTFAIDGLARNLDIPEKIKNGQLDDIVASLDIERKINKNFDTITLINPEGKVVLVSTDYPELKKMTGQTFSDLDYVKKVVATQNMYVSNVFKGKADKYLITYSAPVFDKNGQLVYIATGSNRLDQLTEKFQIKNNLDNSYFILTDNLGNIFMENNTVPIDNLNIKDVDDIIEKLNEQDHFDGIEFNYKKEKVFVNADSIALAGGNKIFTISYYPTRSFDEEKKLTTAEIKRIQKPFGIFTIVLLLMLTTATVMGIRNYEKNKNKS